MERRAGSSVRTLAAAQCLIVAAACQSGQGTTAVEPPSTDRLEFVSQFKKIDAAGKGLITIEQATAHYGVVFSELDRNRDGFLDVNELQALLPVMGAKSGVAFPSSGRLGYYVLAGSGKGGASLHAREEGTTLFGN